jgi:hypothetical protein
MDGNHLFSQPPLWVELAFGGHEDPYTLVIVRCLEGLEGDERVRSRHLAQAQFIADLVERVDRGGLIVIGSLNAAPESAIVEALSERGLRNLLAEVSLEARYTCLDGGMPCIRDYVFVNEDLADECHVLPIHINADFPDRFGTDPTTVIHSSAHDPLLVYTSRGGQVREPRPPVTLIPHQDSPTLMPDPTGTTTPSSTPTPYPATLLIT